jgi:hypothetical protein
MKSLVCIACLIVLSLTASIAPAQRKVRDMTVFGFQLGEKFAIHECSREIDVVSLQETRRYVIQNPLSPCFEWLDMTTKYVSDNTPVKTAKIGINLPLDQTPAILSESLVNAQVVDGNLESISYSTGGLKSQDRVLAVLEKKYGKPTRFKEDRKQNTFGALFVSHYAEWGFLNFTVTFWGATDSRDSGSVRIESKKGAEFTSALLKQSSHNGPNL